MTQSHPLRQMLPTCVCVEVRRLESCMCLFTDQVDQTAGPGQKAGFNICLGLINLYQTLPVILNTQYMNPWVHWFKRNKDVSLFTHGF